MITVYATIPLFLERDIKVADLEIRVRPLQDNAFPDGIADDISFAGSDHKWHQFSREREKEILALIEVHDPQAFWDIVAARAENTASNIEESQAEFMA